MELPVSVIDTAIDLFFNIIEYIIYVICFKLWSFEDCDEIQNALSGDKCLDELEDRIEKDNYASVNQVINNSRDEWVQGPAKQEETFKKISCT